jgi:hypothetical protein
MTVKSLPSSEKRIASVLPSGISSVRNNLAAWSVPNNVSCAAGSPGRTSGAAYGGHL